MKFVYVNKVIVAITMEATVAMMMVRTWHMMMCSGWGSFLLLTMMRGVGKHYEQPCPRLAPTWCSASGGRLRQLFPTPPHRRGKLQAVSQHVNSEISSSQTVWCVSVLPFPRTVVLLHLHNLCSKNGVLSLFLATLWEQTRRFVLVYIHAATFKDGVLSLCPATPPERITRFRHLRNPQPVEPEPENPISYSTLSRKPPRVPVAEMVLLCAEKVTGAACVCLCLWTSCFEKSLSCGRNEILCICPPVCLSVDVSICPQRDAISICRSICLSVSLSLCLPTYLFVFYLVTLPLRSEQARYGQASPPAPQWYGLVGVGGAGAGVCGEGWLNGGVVLGGGRAHTQALRTQGRKPYNVARAPVMVW